MPQPSAPPPSQDQQSLPHLDSYPLYPSVSEYPQYPNYPTDSTHPVYPEYPRHSYQLPDQHCHLYNSNHQQPQNPFSSGYQQHECPSINSTQSYMPASYSKVPTGYPAETSNTDDGKQKSKESNKGIGDVAQFGKTVLQSGIMGRKGQYAGFAMEVANGDAKNKAGGLIGTAAASGLMGHKGRIAPHALGLGKEKGHGGISTQNVLNSGLLGSKGIVAGAALKLVKGKNK